MTTAAHVTKAVKKKSKGKLKSPAPHHSTKEETESKKKTRHVKPKGN